jgi:hypothetical protein
VEAINLEKVSCPFGSSGGPGSSSHHPLRIGRYPLAVRRACPTLSLLSRPEGGEKRSLRCSFLLGFFSATSIGHIVI